MLFGIQTPKHTHRRRVMLVCWGIFICFIYYLTFQLMISARAYANDINDSPEILKGTESLAPRPKLPADEPLPLPKGENVPSKAAPLSPEKTDFSPLLSSTPQPSPSPPVPSASRKSNGPPVVDNFPLAAAAHSPDELPPIPSWNQPPHPHVKESTPLFIGFTRNWRMLQSVVVGYITAGWPPSDIYVVENTGVMDSNRNGLLSIQNPFFLNHTRLEMLGVNVLITPTLFTFSQLQNFFLWTSVENEWPQYFWSHMDIIVLSYEDTSPSGKIDPKTTPSEEEAPTNSSSEGFKSFYSLAVEELRNSTRESEETGKQWGMRWFWYDWFTLVNTKAYKEVGGWDTMIPYYASDCDMHARVEWAGYNIKTAHAGLIFDVGSGLQDLQVLYRKKAGPEPSFQDNNPHSFQSWQEDKGEEGEEEGKEKVKSDGKVEEEKLYKQEKQKEKRTWMGLGKSIQTWEEDEIASDDWKKLRVVLQAMMTAKWDGKGGKERQRWQMGQTGGEGEPFYKDPKGFETALRTINKAGQEVYDMKWGSECDLKSGGVVAEDAWKDEILTEEGKEEKAVDVEKEAKQE